MIGLPVPREEMIDCESWYALADYHYTNERTNFPTGIIHVDMGSIPNFFDKIKYNKEKYVVISSRCDFGLHYQAIYPPWQDYHKMAQQLLMAENTKDGYADITLPPPINRARCNSEHKYSIKCYRYTEATFDKIPDNILHWFVVNNTIYNDSRITSIPFGINGTDGNKKPGDHIFQEINKSNINGDRDQNLYVNFQFYTNERVRLYSLYSSGEFGVMERDVPFSLYLKRLLTHNCNLCPPGNGWDCYRTLETLYMGCIPIMEVNAGTWFYTQLNLPIIFTNTFEAITGLVLNAIKQSECNDRTKWNLETVTLSYWKNLIQQKAKLL